MDQPDDAPAGMTGGMIVTTAAAETRARGRELGQSAHAGAFLALIGPLGAGKTEMAKGVAEGLGVASVVNSPTFVLMNEHQGRLPLFHIDAYRLTEPEEAVAAGLLEERQADGVTVAEWADRLDGWLPGDRLELQIEPDPELADRRTITWRATGVEHARLAARAFAP
jgi:tRNA threonylcarbamoyladenosine biosynthesis protein TsaE